MSGAFLCLRSLINACIENKKECIDIRLDYKDCKNIKAEIDELEEKASQYDDLCK